MSCPRCGSNKTSRAVRKEGRGRKAVETNIVDEWCDDCGWHGYHVRQPLGNSSPAPQGVSEESGVHGQEV